MGTMKTPKNWMIFFNIFSSVFNFSQFVNYDCIFYTLFLPNFKCKIIFKSLLRPYIRSSPREREKEKKWQIREKKMSKSPPPASIESYGLDSNSFHWSLCTKFKCRLWPWLLTWFLFAHCLVMMIICATLFSNPTMHNEVTAWTSKCEDLGFNYTNW